MSECRPTGTERLRVAAELFPPLLGSTERAQHPDIAPEVWDQNIAERLNFYAEVGRRFSPIPLDRLRLIHDRPNTRRGSV